MSLLNDMLKDLDKTKRSAEAKTRFLSTPKPGLLSELALPNFWLLTPFVIGALILGGVYFHDSNQSHARAPLKTVAISRLPAISKRPVVAQPSVPEEPRLSSELPAIVFNASTHLLPPKADHLTALIDEDEASNAQINKIFVALTDTEWHDEHLNLALTAIQDGHEDHAEEVLNQILAKFPKATVARETLATLLLSEERFDEARTVLDEGLIFSPHAVSLSTIKARLAFEENHPKEALQILKQFRPDIRSNPDFYGLMAAVLQSLGQMSEAGNLYKLLVEVEPTNGQYWLGYGIALEQSQSTIQAITAYQKATRNYDIEPAVRAYAENRLKVLQG